MKLTDKEMYESALEYAQRQANMIWWKILALGIMGGAFIAIGYMGAITMQSWNGDETLGKFLGAAIFPTGIILCMFMGGSLFTSDSLSLLAVAEKKTKWYIALRGLGLVLLGNLIGGCIMAGIAVGAGFYHGEIVDVAKNEYDGTLGVLQHYVHSKQDMKWYGAMFSGVLCNFMVAGAVLLTLSTHSTIGKIILLWFPVTLFVAAGFQHIVANFFIFWSGLFEPESGMKVGEFITHNLLPTTLGNWISGAVLLPMPYFLVNKYSKMKIAKEASPEGTIEVKDVEKMEKALHPDDADAEEQKHHKGDSHGMISEKKDD